MLVTTTHLAAHVIIFLGYILACVLVPTALLQLMKIRTATVAAAAGFFVFCGLTHIGLAFDQSEATWVTVTDHAQAASILTFVVLLSLDLARTVDRLTTAFSQINREFGAATGDRVATHIKRALRGS